MWGSIVALLERSPTMLGRLPDHWWRDARFVEWLSAMATWRTNIDAASEDQREEIAFHNDLQQLARIIDQTPGGRRRFKSTACQWIGASEAFRWRTPRNQGHNHSRANRRSPARRQASRLCSHKRRSNSL
jgi:hypothetical protein